MVLENTVVTVATGNRVLCAYNKLVCIAGMLVIVDQVGNEYWENVKWFELSVSLEVADIYEEVHCLQGVNNVHLVVVGVLGRVPLIHLQAQFVARIHWKGVFVVEIVVLANPVEQVWQGVLLHTVVVLEHVEADFLPLLTCGATQSCENVFLTHLL